MKEVFILRFHAPDYSSWNDVTLKTNIALQEDFIAENLNGDAQDLADANELLDLYKEELARR